MAKPLKEVDKKLIEECCEKEDLDYKTICNLLAQGADPSKKLVLPGVWGAQSEYSSLHGVLRAEKWDTRKKASIALKVVQELLKHGADSNSETINTNWKGAGSQKSAFEMACNIVLWDQPGISDIHPKLIRVFLDNGANPFAVNTRHIASMRSDGKMVTPVWHSMVEAGKAEIVAEILKRKKRIEVDQEATGWISNERGCDSDYIKTALHKACELKDHMQAYHIAYMLLQAGANPNLLLVDLEIRSRPGVSMNDMYYGDPRSLDYEPSVESFRTLTTPLHIAIKHDNVPLVWLLVKFGADKAKPSIDCQRFEFPKQYFANLDFGMLNSKQTAFDINSTEECYKFFLKHAKNASAIISTEKQLEESHCSNSEEMCMAIEGNLPPSYEALIDSNMFP